MTAVRGAKCCGKRRSWAECTISSRFFLVSAWPRRTFTLREIVDERKAHPFTYHDKDSIQTELDGAEIT